MSIEKLNQLILMLLLVLLENLQIKMALKEERKQLEEVCNTLLREFFRNDELLKLIKFTPTMEDKTFIIQGLGNVGYHAAKFISEDNK